MKNLPNIAVCFYGQLRFYEIFKFYDNLIKKFESNFNFDFFLSTWNDFDENKLNFKFKQKKIIDKYIFDKSQEGKGNTRKMTFLLSNVLSLKKKYEIDNNLKYDLVLLIRPDVVFKIDDFKNVVKYILNDYDIKNKEFVFITEKYHLDSDGYNKINQDYIFLMSSSASDKHSLIYDFFYIKKQFKNYPTKYKEGGHWIHIYLFLHHNFIINEIFLPSLIVRPMIDKNVLNNIIDEDFLRNLILNRKKLKYNFDEPYKFNKNWKEKIT